MDKLINNTMTGAHRTLQRKAVTQNLPDFSIINLGHDMQQRRRGQGSAIQRPGWIAVPRWIESAD